MEDEKCGLGPCCTFGSLQFLACKEAFLSVFCLAVVLQGMHMTYFVSILTTIEKLFQIPSQTTGIIMSATEIGLIGGSLLLTYYGGQGHRPRWIGWGVLLFAFSSLLCSLPHFLFGSHLVATLEESYPVEETTHPHLCSLNSSLLQLPSECKGEDGGPQTGFRPYVIFIFFLSLMGIGIGTTAVYTLGIPYIDDNVASRESPLYFGITIGIRILGPVFGFLLGSLCVKMYVYPFMDGPVDPTDYRWIGAWWLGPFVIATLLAMASVGMFAFPRQLKLSKTTAGTSSLAAVKPTLREFPKAVHRLLGNSVLLLRTGSNVLHLLPISGLYTFLPKYLESQFHVTSHNASLILAFGGILVMGVGIFLSGWYIRKTKPSPRFVAGWIAWTALIYSLGMGVLMFIGCPMKTMVGLSPLTRQINMTSCNGECDCENVPFSPLCGSDNQTYFSPCHAGCTSYMYNASSRHHFGNCSCMELEEKAKEGFCTSHECTSLKWYIILFSIFAFVHSTSDVGSMLLTLRCVDPKDKAMALGLIQFAIGLFGNVPCPIIYGLVIDSACIIWGTRCGQRGACWLYDPSTFRYFFHGTTALLMLLAFFVDILVWCKSDEIQFQEETRNDGPKEEREAIIQYETCL